MLIRLTWYWLDIFLFGTMFLSGIGVSTLTAPVRIFVFIDFRDFPLLLRSILLRNYSFNFFVDKIFYHSKWLKETLFSWVLCRIEVWFFYEDSYDLWENTFLPLPLLLLSQTFSIFNIHLIKEFQTALLLLD